ncbi:hypothetical protein E4T56_gene20619 [Termitomyces sp. T112]|nr:hypothetical protein E4T56_gene20619 [Termitomyces sp. T112]
MRNSCFSSSDCDKFPFTMDCVSRVDREQSYDEQSSLAPMPLQPCSGNPETTKPLSWHVHATERFSRPYGDFDDGYTTD